MFALHAAKLYPHNANILELGAGSGQDSRYFAGLGHTITCTDIEPSALQIAKSKGKTTPGITYQIVDLAQPLPFTDSSFDVVYAHLSLHYFTKSQTTAIFSQIERVLIPGGLLAFLVNSTADPEFGSGRKIETDYFQVGSFKKRYFSPSEVERFCHEFIVIELDSKGETYKDRSKGVHNLLRFIGRKSPHTADATRVQKTT